ncbi:MAG: pentapeptide repeat-containing protein [Telmatospirillum sp.]|nr:pentapeptide repeat-containing protein [Telmatospirillum sp.]
MPPVGKPVPAVAIRRVADGEGSGPIPPATPVGAGAPDYSLLDDLPARPAPSPGIELASAAAEPRETAISATVDDDTGLPGNRASPPLEVLPPTEPSGTDGLEVRTRRKREPGESTGDADIDAILALHAQWVESGGQQGRRAKLEGREIAGRSLAGAVLTSALLRRADISASDATDALMHGIDLRNADATGTRFVGADLAVARLRHARLCGCDLTGATLKGADLAGADLTGARFGHADLAGAILLGAHLAGADLSGVAGLTQAQLEGVDGDARTRLPPGLRLPVGPED